MPAPYCVDDFEGKVDSLYRLVIIGSRRANQISKSESHGFGPVSRAKKSTMMALEEVMAGKVGYYTSTEEDETYLD